MGTITPIELLKLWELEKVPVEMTTGHTLQNLIKIQATIDTITSALSTLRADIWPTTTIITH